MTKIFRFVLNAPRSLIAGTLFCTLLFLWQIPDVELDPSLRSMIPRDNPSIVTMDRIDELFGGTEIIIVGVESDSLLWEQTLRHYAALQDSLEGVNQLSKVMSLYTAPLIASTTDGFTVEDILQTYPQTAAEVTALQERIRSMELVYGQLVSEDFRGMAFVCQVDETFDYDEHALTADITQVVSSFTGTEKIYVSGLPITRATIVTNMQGDMKKFMPFGVALMIVLLAFSFRSWLGVFLPLIVVIIAVIWTFGLMGLLRYKLPFIGVLIPVMLIAIANDYGIHIIAHYYEFSQANQASKLDTVKKTLQKLGAPILIAGGTTVIGFLSLLGHILPKIRDFGLFVSFGIGMAFLFSIFLIPAALIIARRPYFLDQPGSFRHIDAVLEACGRFFIRVRQPFVLIMIVVLLFMGLGIRKIVVDTDPDHYYHEDSEFQRQNRAITRLFGGSSQMMILVEGDIKDPETLGQIDRLGTHLSRHPLVSHTVSITSQVKTMHSAFHAGREEYQQIPEDRNLIAQYLFLYSLSGDPEDLERLIDDIDEPRYALILARLKHIKTSQIVEIVKDTNEFIRINFHNNVKMLTSGPATLMSEMAHLIVRGQMLSLSISLVVIFIIMSLIFRSLYGGLFSIIPLGTAILLVFGLMGYLGIELNMATAMLSSIMIGVGVDYTVHFLWHLRDHIRAGAELEPAIYATLRISGKGIVFNALSVVIGFTVLILSAFLPVYFFGFLITMSISMCLFGALALLPALVSWWKPEFLLEARSRNET